MDWLSWLWLPIVLSAAGVWIASFLTWTVLPTHKGDFIGLPDETKFIDTVRGMGVNPGNYGFPHFACHKDANTPEAKAMWKDGPVGFITVMSNPTSMGPRMLASFMLNLIVAFLIAYVAAESLPKGATFAKVFQVIGTVGVERRQAMSPLVSSEQIQQGAAEAYAKVIAEARAKNMLNRDATETARVRQITMRLIPPTAVFRNDALGWDWAVNVIRSDEVNAWAMPGGKIAVYSALIEKLKLSDDELAAVLGHEIAHALREHGREQASRAVTESVGLGVLGAATGVGDAGAALAQLALDVTINLPHSRSQETEADRIGVELAARAGYDPRAAVTLWQKMGALSDGNATPRWLSTHPSPETRLADLDAYAAKVMPLVKGR